MLEIFISFLWRFFGQKGDPFGLMFFLAELHAQLQNKKSAITTD